MGRGAESVLEVTFFLNFLIWKMEIQGICHILKYLLNNSCKIMKKIEDFVVSFFFKKFS